MGDSSTGRCIGQIEKTDLNNEGHTLYYVLSDKGYHSVVDAYNNHFTLPDELDFNDLSSYLILYGVQEDEDVRDVVVLNENENFIAQPFYIEFKFYNELKPYYYLSNKNVTSAVLTDLTGYHIGSKASSDGNLVDCVTKGQVVCIGLIGNALDENNLNGAKFHRVDSQSESVIESLSGFPKGGLGTQDLVQEEKTLPFDCYKHNNPNA